MAILSAHGLDLASFAATVASDTAHLTNLSVSPTSMAMAEHGQEFLGTVQDGDGNISPPSPYYDEEGENVELSDPSTKSIDYQNTKRQKVKPPPTTDWSPVTDLSPILDVSPSVEKAEQEAMLQQRRQMAAAGLITDPGASDLNAPGNMDNNNLTIQGEPKIQMGLKRYHAFEDITKIGNGDLKRAAEIADMMARGQSVTHLTESMPYKASSMEPADYNSHMQQQSTAGMPPSSLQQHKGIEHEQQQQLHLQEKYNNSERTGTVERAYVPGKLVSNLDNIPYLDDALEDHSKPEDLGVNSREVVEPLIQGNKASLIETIVPSTGDSSSQSASSSSSTIHFTSQRGHPPSTATAGEVGIPQQQQTPGSHHQHAAAIGLGQRSLSDDQGTLWTHSRSPREDGRGLGPRSLSDDQAQVKDSAKVKPHPLRIPAIDGEDDVTWSPHSKVLKSPISPRYKASEECGEEVEISPSVVQDDATAYLYPSPQTPPDTSPPQPRSPSITKTEVEEPSFILSAPSRPVTSSTLYDSNRPVSSTLYDFKGTSVSAFSTDLSHSTPDIPSAVNASIKILKVSLENMFSMVSQSYFDMSPNVQFCILMALISINLLLNFKTKMTSSQYMNFANILMISIFSFPLTPNLF